VRKKNILTVTILALFAILFLSSGFGGQSPNIVTFADSKLELRIRETLGIPQGKPITVQDMRNLITLDAEGCGVIDLSGLEYAVNLERLDLGYNQIIDITPLRNLVNLRKLYLDHNLINDITPLKNLTNLESLYLNSNQISDITPLVQNVGINNRDYVDIKWNNLDLITNSDDNINTLTNRGVTVEYELQKFYENECGSDWPGYNWPEYRWPEYSWKLILDLQR